jgi:transcriptional regulator with XRE-family HTH domain
VGNTPLKILLEDLDNLLKGYILIGERSGQMDGAEMFTLRQQLGFSRAQLAAELGVHWNTVNKWERGDNKISEPVARLLRRIVAERVTLASKEKDAAAAAPGGPR